MPPSNQSRISQPAYLALWQSGELARRVERALGKLADCTLCPRDCHVDRLADKFSVCRVGRHAPVSSYFPHFGEEDCLRGCRGSGAIFILQWVARELGPDTYVNVMSQYFPAGKVSANDHAEINRNIALREFQEALDAAHETGLRRLDQRAAVRAMMEA